MDTVVHGKCSLPVGYMLSRVPANALISSSINRPADSPPQSDFHVSNHQDATPMTYNIPRYMLSRVLLISSSVNRPADGPPQSNFHVSYHQDATPMSTYNIPKLIIGLVQAIWATSTLYRARGDQIDRYGYAAFGLTVTPYAFMSVLNIIANISNPV